MMAQVPDDRENEENAQINQEEYEFWVYETAVKEHNQYLEVLAKGEHCETNCISFY